MFSVTKSWDNRKVASQKNCIKGRTWTRRIRWLEDLQGLIKLKLEDGTAYREVLVICRPDADTVWQRFKEGQSIDDSVSILGGPVPKGLASKKEAEDLR